ncbi:hypothetical protein COLO4_00777 [Corchorus olitorius]|uniref:Uncharacterized protein n=1 Tax=Corchorus olitorius TaxID=93759 RepID=A0A1R3L3E6_9ROSI|nr:hypothetical protein COLO4_00777 [Corchorus olitorius]
MAGKLPACSAALRPKHKERAIKRPPATTIAEKPLNKP